jgi:hypothetical protein
MIDTLEQSISQEFGFQGVHSIGELVHKRGGTDYMCKRDAPRVQQLFHAETCFVSTAACDAEHHKQLLQQVNMHTHTSNIDELIFEITDDRHVLLWSEDGTTARHHKGVETYMYAVAVEMKESVTVKQVQPAFHKVFRVMETLLKAEWMDISQIAVLSANDRLTTNFVSTITDSIREVHPSLTLTSVHKLAQRITARVGMRPRSFVWMPPKMPHAAGGGSAREVLTFVASASKPVRA